MHLFAKARHVLAFVAASPEDPMKSIMLSFMALFLLLSPSARAQGVGASGQIKGTVFDPSGSVIPSATVEAVDTAKGTRYTAVSDVTGQYQFAILPPSTYDVTSRFSGLQTQVQKGLLLQVGQTAIVDFPLALAGTKVEMEVSAGGCRPENTPGGPGGKNT